MKSSLENRENWTKHWEFRKDSIWPAQKLNEGVIRRHVDLFFY